MQHDEDVRGRSRRDSLAGQIVAGHELLRVLAVGGMGEVYLARHLALGMMRAFKVIKTDMRSSETSRGRFEKEAQVLARLHHNSIVHILEFGTLPNGWPFLATEYIDGPSLAEIAHQSRMPTSSALVVLEQVVGALAYAHSVGIIHRDLEPANILLRSGDIRQVKIVDFGLARVLDDDAAKRLTVNGQLIGSPAFMAPEQAEGERDVTAAVDVYAVAGIAYTLLSGEPPFSAATSMQPMAAQVHAPPPRLSERCPEISPLLDSLLLSCLAKDPAQRPRSDELLAHLERLTSGHELAAGSGGRFVVIDVAEAAESRSIAREILGLRADPGTEAAALVERVMGLIREIAGRLSTSDRELTSLLVLEMRIREQLDDLADAVPSRDVAERKRVLHVQQEPLQRRIIEVVEAHRRQASGAIKALFREIDRTLDALDELRRKMAT